MSGTTSNGHHSRWWQFGKSKPKLAHDPLSAYRRVAVQLQYDLPRPSNSRSVLFASPTASHLSARASINLAACLAEELGRRVLLIDTCTKTPELSRLLECGEAKGFSDFLSHPSGPLNRMFLQTTHQDLWFLPAGRSSVPCQTQPEAIRSLLLAAESECEFVVLSGGPVLTDTTTLTLAPFVGCVLLSVIENETAADDLNAAQETLSYCKPRKIGIVLTTPVRTNGWYAKPSTNGTILSIKTPESQ